MDYEHKMGTHHKTAWVRTDPATKPAVYLYGMSLKPDQVLFKKKNGSKQADLNIFCSHQCRRHI